MSRLLPTPPTRRVSVRWLAATLAVATLGAGCRFGVNRQLEPGDIRATLVFETATGEKLPAADARIVIENSPFATKTDARGRFVFRKIPVGDYRLRITYTVGGADNALRLGPVTVKPRDARDLGTLNVTRLGQLRGTIVRGPGNPIRAEIALPGFEPQVTADDGRFDFARVAADAWPVLVVAPLNGTLAYYDLPPVDVTPGAPTEKEFDLAALDPVAVADVSTLVRLSGADDHSGARVRFSGPEGPIDLPATNADGRISANLPPGIYSVLVEHDDYLPLVMQFVVVAGETDLPTILLAPDTCADTPDAEGCAEVDVAADTDADEVNDFDDNCPLTANTDQLDTDSNGIGDACTPVPPDLEPPAAPVLDGSGGRTNRASIDVEGSVGPDVTQVLVFKNLDCSGETPVSVQPTAGRFSATIALVSGETVAFCALALDAAGNRSPPSNSIQWISDQEVPGVPAFVSFTPPPPSTATTVTVRLSLSGEAGTTIFGFAGVSCTGVEAGNGVVDVNGFADVAVAPVAGSQNPYSFLARDAAGNEGDCTTELISYDLEPPNADAATFSIPGGVEVAGVQWFSPADPPVLEWTGFLDADSYEWAWASDGDCLTFVNAVTGETATTVGGGAPVELESANGYACLRGVDDIGNRTDWLVWGPVRIDATGPTLEVPFAPTPTGSVVTVQLGAAADAGVGLAALPYEIVECTDLTCNTNTSLATDVGGPTFDVTVPACERRIVGVYARDLLGNTSAHTLVELTGFYAAPGNLAVFQRFGFVELAWDAAPGTSVRYEVCSNATDQACAAGWDGTPGKGTSVRLYEPHASRRNFAVRAIRDGATACISSEAWVAGRPADLTGAFQDFGPAPGDRMGAALLAIEDPLDSGTRLLFGVPGGVFAPGAVKIVRRNPADGGLQVLATLTGDAAGDEFGFALASAGDVDGDGIEDFAVGAPGARDGTGVANTGYVKVFAGRDFSLITKLQASSAPPGVQQGTRFGAKLAGGANVTGDAQPDLLVGAPSADPAYEPITCSASQPASLAYCASLGLTCSAISGSRQICTSSCATAACPAKYTCNGTNQLCEPNAGALDADAGVVHVYVGQPGGTFTRLRTDRGLTDGDQFGTTLSMVGDLDGDGKSEFFSGSPFVLSTQGGGAITGGAGLARLLPNQVLASSATDSFASWVIPVGDMDGRGKPDFAVGAPFAEGANGAVSIFAGEEFLIDSGQCATCTAGCPPQCDPSNLQPFTRIIGESALGTFGTSGACIGDLDDDGRCELAITSRSTATVTIHSYDGTQWNLLKRYTGLATSANGAIVVGGGDPARSGVPGFAYGAPQDASLGSTTGQARWFFATSEDNPPTAFASPGSPLVPKFEPLKGTSEGPRPWALPAAQVSLPLALRPDSISSLARPLGPSGLEASLVYNAPSIGDGFGFALGWQDTPFLWHLPFALRSGAIRSLPNASGPSHVVTLGDWTGDAFADVAVAVPGAGPTQGGEGAVYVLNGMTGAIYRSFRGGSFGAGLGWAVVDAGEPDGAGNGCLLAGAPGLGGNQGAVQLLCESASTSAAFSTVVRATWPNPGGISGRFGSSLAFIPGVNLNGTGGADFVVGVPSANPGAVMGDVAAYELTTLPVSPWRIINGSPTTLGTGLGSAVAIVAGVATPLIVASTIQSPSNGANRGAVHGFVANGSGNTPLWSAFGWADGAQLGTRLVTVPGAAAGGAPAVVANYAIGQAAAPTGVAILDGNFGTIRSAAAPGGLQEFGRTLSTASGAITGAGRIEMLVGSGTYGNATQGATWVLDVKEARFVRARASLDFRTTWTAWGVGLLPDRDGDGLSEWVVADREQTGNALVQVMPSAQPAAPSGRPSIVTMGSQAGTTMPFTWTPFLSSGTGNSRVELRRPGRAATYPTLPGDVLSSSELTGVQSGETYFIRVRETVTSGGTPTAWSVMRKWTAP